MILCVTSAEYAGDYKIKVTFNDSTSGIADFKETILSDQLPIIRELIDIEKFKDFRIKFDTITWSNGLDLAPEFIKSLVRKKKTESSKNELVYSIPKNFNPAVLIEDNPPYIRNQDVSTKTSSGTKQVKS